MSIDAWLGVDLGGTNCRLALVSGAGELLESRRFPTRVDLGPEDLIIRLSQALRELAETASGRGLTLGGIGMASAGVIDRPAGVVRTSPNLPRFRDVALGPDLERATGFRVVLENDANLYALGEHLYGAGRGVSDLLCFTLGTGVGGGLIIAGRLVVGPLATGGEVGHLMVEPEGRLCGCGAPGCLEAYASATGLRGMLAEELAAGTQTRLRAGDDPEAMAQAAGEGDALARELFQRAGRAMGRAMTQAISLTGVGLMIIGGGMAPAWPFMEPAARRELRTRVRMIDPDAVLIRPGELGQQAAVRGAAALARRRLS